MESPVDTVTPKGSSITSFGCANPRAHYEDGTTKKYWCEVIVGQLSGIVIVPNHGRMSIAKGLCVYASNNCPTVTWCPISCKAVQIHLIHGP